MATAREVMTRECRCVGEHQTLAEAARMMRDLNVGALPICGDDDRLKGMLTDRDIVVRCIAENGDPAETAAGALARGKPICVDADTPMEQVMDIMSRHQIRRVPVIENKRLVGIISQADVARQVPEQRTGKVVEEISANR
ncbi:CBS domain-containing protein [Gandjariella thermophila]|uniref:Hypoxic response protein 1 n=1 Tax=Gandjariella thermophila TaxID=1931992 RepID=A0A4D4JDU1_9PSEU|nr:CBS domain-containing protein [Gandjariella thermophila]GDY33582.1 hypoxic response protein 1 [Gandjariella thermophila]